MKYLRKFNQLFESGLRHSETMEIETVIRELISTGNYSPNIENFRGFHPPFMFQGIEEPEEKKTRKFNITVSGNTSKFGLILEVAFRLDYPVGYDEINYEFKQGTLPLEIKDIISQMMSKNVTLYGFDFFGNKVMGQKDGRTLEVEDVQDKFDITVEQLDSTPDKVSDTYSPIIFWFLLK